MKKTNLPPLLRRVTSICAGLLLTFTATSAEATQQYLPNATVTPGAINPAVTQANIASTICTLGFTKKIRPPVSYTTQLKRKQLSTPPYSAYGTTDTRSFEEDHLISLELGGSPYSPKNLWPEPWSGPNGARLKDQLENKLHAMVCSHQITLAQAQKEIATNWYEAYRRNILQN